MIGVVGWLAGGALGVDPGAGLTALAWGLLSLYAPRADARDVTAATGDAAIGATGDAAPGAADVGAAGDVTGRASERPDPITFACAGCHPREAREHARSRHAVAFTNGLFAREFRDAPRPWCVTCHAPEVSAAERDRATDADPRARAGVSCASCHVRDGAIVTRAPRPGSPHRHVTDPAFGTDAFCGGCHQFAFPVLDAAGRFVRATDEPMQDTLAQFRAGPLGDDPRGCLRCHARTPAGHVFAGSHDPAMLRRAASLAVCAEPAARGRAAMRVTVANRGAGHNLPTGGVNRFMVVRVWRSSAPGRMFEARLGREFEPVPGGGKRTTEDTTIPPGGRRSFRVALTELGGEPVEPVHAELRYVYTPDEHTPLPTGEPTSRVVASHTAAADRLAPCAR